MLKIEILIFLLNHNKISKRFVLLPLWRRKYRNQIIHFKLSFIWCINPRNSFWIKSVIVPWYLMYFTFFSFWSVFKYVSRLAFKADWTRRWEFTEIERKGKKSCWWQLQNRLNQLVKTKKGETINQAVILRKYNSSKFHYTVFRNGFSKRHVRKLSERRN